jgi:hypothetical protein
MVGAGANFAAAPRSRRQLAWTFLSSTFTIFAIIQIAAAWDVETRRRLELKSSSEGIIPWGPER